MSRNLYTIKINEGYLIGKGCGHCVEAWLTDRGVSATLCKIKDVPKNNPVYHMSIEEINNTLDLHYEITGKTRTAIHAHIMPHKTCKTPEKHVPFDIKDATNYSYCFTPIMKLNVLRYGTPSGNIWVATGITDDNRVTYSAGTNREHTRNECARKLLIPNYREQEKQIIEHVINKYRKSFKNPMLVVGALDWIKTRVPFFLLQNYDIHLLFYPNRLNTWVVGAYAFSRIKADEKPVYVWNTRQDIQNAIETCLFKLIYHCAPKKEQYIKDKFNIKSNVDTNQVKKNVWNTHWLYRSPKISLKDILKLNSYESPIEMPEKCEDFNTNESQAIIYRICE